MKRGEIWIVDFNPTCGAEIKKIRPAIIISNDMNNQHASTITVIPVSDKGEKIYPVEVDLLSEKTGLRKESKAKCQQIRTVDKSRFKKLLGVVSKTELQKLQQAASIHLGF